MRRLLFTTLLCLGFLASFAQGDGSGRVRGMRVAYITEKLNLPPEQNARFWSVYNRYLDERAALRNEYKNQFKQNKQATVDAGAANQFVDDNIEYKERDLQLSKKYKDELLRVINAQQLAELYQIERDFKQRLIQQLRAH